MGKTDIPKVHPHLDSYQRPGDGYSKFSLRIAINGSKRLYPLFPNSSKELYMHKQFWVNEVEQCEKTGKIKKLKKKRIKKIKGNPNADKVERDLFGKVKDMEKLLNKLAELGKPITHSIIKKHWSRRQSETFSVWFKHWMEHHCESRNLAELTLERWGCIHRHIKLFEEFHGACSVGSISAEWLREWQSWLYAPREQNVKGQWTGQGLAGTTAENSIGKTCYALKKALKEGEIPVDPTVQFYDEYFIEPDEPEGSFLEPEDIDRLHEAYISRKLIGSVFTKTGKVSCMGSRLHAYLGICLFGIYSGLRYSDLRAISNGLDTVHVGTEFITITMKKTGRTIRLFITDKMREVANLSGVGSVFFYKIPNNWNLNKNLRRILNSVLGYDRGMTVHGLRRSFATWLINQGVRLEVISILLGHRQITTTHDQYANVQDLTVKEAMEVWDDVKSAWNNSEVRELVEDFYMALVDNPGMKIRERLRKRMQILIPLYNLQELDTNDYYEGEEAVMAA